MAEPTPQISPRLLLLLIMGGLMFWGIYVAIGVYLYNYNPWQAVVVLGFVASFLGLWLLLLKTQKREKQE